MLTNGRVLRDVDPSLRSSGGRRQTLKLVRKATAGFVATADLLPADFMPEMVELYPDARVVLVRRDANRWWDSVAAMTSRMTPSWLGAVLAPIPGWRHLVTFARVYSRSTLRLAGLDDPHASLTDLIKHGGPREFSFTYSPPSPPPPFFLIATRRATQTFSKPIKTKSDPLFRKTSC